MSAPIARNWWSFMKFLVVLLICHLCLNAINAISPDFHDFFLCRKCGREIVELADLDSRPSESALRQRNDTFGPKNEILIQLFKNPQGIQYEVITTRKANIARASEEIGGDTWWNGFSWRMLVCPQCHHHIGWEYIPVDKKDVQERSFFGLILGNLLYENDADNLLVVPKAYRS